MRSSWLWLLLFAFACQAITGEGAEPTLSLVRPDGSLAWTARLSRGESSATDPAPRGLTTGPWFAPLPEVELQPLQGAPHALSDSTGRVLILAFWATWCEPCAEELTRLQMLQKEESDRGLEVITVNMQEPADTVRQFAWTLNLELPIVRYTPELDRAFEVRSLPTAILADRTGRVRSRFNGYRPGIDEQIAEEVRALLEPTKESAERVADVLVGDGLLEVRWSRPVPGNPEGLTLASGETTTILVAAGRELLHYDAEGRILHRRMGRTSLRELVSGDFDGDGFSEIVAMRRGGNRIVPIDVAEGAGESWEAPAPVLDLEIFPPGSGAERGHLLLLTPSGLCRVGRDGSPLGSPREIEGLIDVAVVTGPGPARIAVLDSAGSLRFLDAELDPSGTSDSPVRGAHLVALRSGAAGVGLVSSDDFSDSTDGSFLGSDSTEIVLASGGALHVFDAASGAERFRARFPGLAAVEAGDLDGDGRDELVVLSHRRITVLGLPTVAQKVALTP